MRCKMLSLSKIFNNPTLNRKLWPLRHCLHKQKRRVLRLSRLYCLFSRRAGGLRQSILSAYKILKEKGVSGLRHALGVSEY